MKRLVQLIIFSLISLFCYCPTSLADDTVDEATGNPASSIALEGREADRNASETGETEAQAKTEPIAGKTIQNSEKEVFIYWENDFILTTLDEQFSMKIRGNLHFDSKFYPCSVNSDKFDIRRARLDFQGRFYKTISFRVQAEFADSPYIRNAWVDFAFSDRVHIRAGQMKPPYSTSWWTTDSNVNFIERGANTPLYPFFDRGWWLWGDIFSKRLTYNISVFNGVGLDYDYNKGDIDDHKDVVCRFFLAPFRIGSPVPLKNLHFCLQYSTGRQSVPTTRFETKGYGAAIRDVKFWTWETETTGYGLIDSRDRWGAEVHYIYGPFSFSSEYLLCRYSGISLFAIDDTRLLTTDGDITSWSTWVSFFLTGEKKRVGNFGWRQPSPKRNFDMSDLSGPGAWEILFRYTSTITAPELFESITYNGVSYTILKGADQVDEYTAALCWTWNPLIRWQVNYVHIECEKNSAGIRTGDSSTFDGSKRVSSEDMIALRMIFKY